MDKILSRLRPISLALLLVAILPLTWANYRFATNNPGGNDFLVHWEGARALLIEGLSPYSDEVAIRIQVHTYGRPAASGEHELRVAYPLYSLVIFAPFALIGDFTLARALWMTFLEIALIAIPFICIMLTRWRPGNLVLIFFLIFFVVWYHGMRPLINGNVVILVTLFLLVAVWFLKTRRDEMVGVMLAISTIKPHIVLLPIIFILLCSVSQKRYKYFFGY